MTELIITEAGSEQDYEDVRRLCNSFLDWLRARYAHESWSVDRYYAPDKWAAVLADLPCPFTAGWWHPDRPPRRDSSWVRHAPEAGRNDLRDEAIVRVARGTRARGRAETMRVPYEPLRREG